MRPFRMNRFSALMAGTAMPARLQPLSAGVGDLMDDDTGQGGGGGGGGDDDPAAAAAAAGGADQNKDIPADAWFLPHVQDADARQWMANKGYTSLEEAIKGHRNAEKAIGAGRLALPKDEADTAGWDAVYKAIGRPDKPEDYKIAEILGVKEGEQVPEFGTKFASLAHQIGLNPRQVKALAEFNQGEIAATKEAEEAAFTTRAAAEIEELQGAQGWGASFKANLAIAKGAMAQFGFSRERVQELERGMGTKGVLEHFLELGKRIGEDGFTGGGDRKLGGYTAEQAAEAKKNFMTNPELVAKLRAKEPSAVAEWSKINAALAAELDRAAAH